jgi:hypothetical protein
MAQAGDYPTSIKELDDLVDYLTENLRCTKDVAVDVMNQHYHGQLGGRLVVEMQDLIRDGEPHGGWVTTNANLWDLKLDRDDHVQVIPRIELWRKAIGRIAEQCDARAIWPPHPPPSEPAPDQQPEDKAGPAVLPVSIPPKRVSTKDWITAEAKRLKKDNEIPRSAYIHPTTFAKLLWDRMKNAADTDKSIRLRRVDWRHIKNQLRKWGLWPIESIKIP